MRKNRQGFTKLFSVAVLAAMGCGEDPAKFTDAPPSAIDAPQTTPDALTAGVVKVTVSRSNAAAVGMQVAFLNADDSVVAVAMTDAEGVATATMLPGGSVTVVLPAINGPRPINAEVYTFEGVKPGDQLLVGPRTPATTTVATEFLVPGAPRGSIVDIQTNCGVGTGTVGTTMTFQATQPCTTTNVFVSARTAAGVDLGQLYKANAAVTNNILDVSAEAYRPAKALTFTLSNIPAVVTDARLSASVVAGKLSMTAPATAPLMFPAPLGTTRAGDITLPDVGGDVLLTSQLSRANGAIEQIIDRAPFGPISIDVTASQIPWMLSAPTFDPGGAQYAWTESADGTADTVIANANISRPAAGNVPAVVWRHQIVAPHAVGRLHVPVLPAAMTAFNAVPSDTVNGFVGLVKLPGGFDSIRAIAFVASGTDTLLPAAGRYVTSIFFPQRG